MGALSRVSHRLQTLMLLARFGMKAAVELVYGQILEFTEPRSRLAHCGKGTYFFQPCSIRSPENVWIGDSVSVGPSNRLWASPGARITIGDDVLFGPNVTIVTSNHGTADLTQPIHLQPWTELDVVIGKGAWIGANVVIVPGVTIGEGVVIGAGAIVTSSIPDFAIAAGVPAKVRKLRG